MDRDFIIQLIKDGHKIEFEYYGKRYYITCDNIDNMPLITFCEFNKEPNKVKDIAALLAFNYKEKIVGDILDCLSEDDVWVF
jgi:hypothetical protein